MFSNESPQQPIPRAKRLATVQLKTLCGGPFSLAAEQGECIALSGPSGCGKTLLLRAIADLDPAEGDVFLDGLNRNDVAAPLWRKKVGWLPAESSWWFDRVGAHFNSPETDQEAASARILTKLGFEPDVVDWKIDRLSTGEKQRLALFRLLLNKPLALLLDEPTAALDRVNVQSVETVIEDYRRTTGAAVLWVSHDPEQSERVADRRARFRDGLLEETP